MLLDNDDGGSVIALGDPIRMIPIIGSSNNDLVMNRAEEQFNHRSRYLGPRGHCAGSGGRRDGGDNAEPRLERPRWRQRRQRRLWRRREVRQVRELILLLYQLLARILNTDTLTFPLQYPCVTIVNSQLGQHLFTLRLSRRLQPFARR